MEKMGTVELGSLTILAETIRQVLNDSALRIKIVNQVKQEAIQYTLERRAHTIVNPLWEV